MYSEDIYLAYNILYFFYNKEFLQMELFFYFLIILQRVFHLYYSVYLPFIKFTGLSNSIIFDNNSIRSLNFFIDKANLTNF